MRLPPSNMKIQDECIPCLFKRILYEINQSTSDTTVKIQAMRAAATRLAETYNPNGCSATIATKIHKAVYAALHNPDPYKRLKEKSNEIAKTLLPNVERMVKNSQDPLHTSMLCSIIGNMLDFGIEGASPNPEKLLETFEGAVAEGLGYDDYPKVKKLLAESKHILFFTDNCGEIVFDKILCRELKYAFPNLKITLIVKGEPVLSDATIKDADDIGFDTVVDEIFTTGCFAVGVDFSSLPERLEKVLKHTDLIVCKGMANYETLTELNLETPVLHLLTVKCEVVAEHIGVNVRSPIALLRR